MYVRLQNISVSLLLPLLLLQFALIGCTPKVEVTAPTQPITVNLNVKIDHEVRVRVEKDLDQVIAPDSKLF